MSRVEGFYRCDICGREKVSVNRWWLVSRTGCAISIRPFDEVIATARGIQHLCGEKCLHKAVEKYADGAQRDSRLYA